MSIEEVRRKLRSNAPHVLIEAPAGCGKTHESVSAAIDIAQSLEEGQKVLLLAHTNTAVQTFRKRAIAAGSKIEATTLDSFALERVAPYARELGFPVPLRMETSGCGGLPFSELPKKLLELYRRAPILARTAAARYPVIILDEHQDASVDQHSIASALALTQQARIRMFGDPMQAIYGFGGNSLVDWDLLATDSAETDILSTPHRWSDAPDLGQWINEARGELIAHRPIPIAKAPKHRVRAIFLGDLLDMPNPNSNMVPVSLIKPLHALLNNLRGTVAVVTPARAHVLGLHRAIGRRIRINEGADYEIAYTALSSAAELVGNPKALAMQVINLLERTCTGCNKAFKNRIGSRLGDQNVDLRRSGAMQGFLETLSLLYSTPTLATWCHIVDLIRRNCPNGLQVDFPDCLRVLGQLRLEGEADPISVLNESTRRRRLSLSQHQATVSTIHKVKGQEYDHVIICHCSATPFPATERGRKLLYVAISRAKLSITILASRNAPSPLL